jgi:hypothetical protein
MDRDDEPDPTGPRATQEVFMTRRILRTVVPAALAMAVAFSGAAEASSHSSSRGRRSSSEDRVKFVAALQGASVARGWGRVEVSDHSHRFDSRRARGKREVEVILVGLEPTALYRVEIDGVTIGGVWTGVTGDGSLTLESPDDSHPPVPAALPGAASLRTVVVFDASNAPVLAGSFAFARGHFDDFDDSGHRSRGRDSLD